MTILPRISATTAIAAVICLAGGALAQDAANLGNLNVSGRRIVLKNVVALRGQSSDENRVVVLATQQALGASLLQQAKDKDAEDNLDGELDQPYLKAVFQEDGTLRCFIGKGAGTSFTERRAPLEGRATIVGGRIRGDVKLIKTGDFAKEVALTFDALIDAPAKAAGPAKLDPPVRPVVSGRFLGNGKPAAIGFVTVEEHEAFSGKEAITLIFSERNSAASKKPSFDAMFGKLGSALILNVFRDGGIFGCQVVHSAHSKSGFSSSGQIHMVEFEIAGGNVTGQVSTGGTLDAFGQKWEVELKFAAPLPASLRTASVTPPKPATNVPPPASHPTPTKPAASSATIFARNLPLPRDARDVQYKALVHQIHLASGQPVEVVANDLSARLKQQGWQDGVGGVRGPKSAILKREQGEAELTIMIQQAPTGSTVKIFADGLDWTGTDSAKPPASSKPAETADDIEKQADKLIKDALKGLPKGL